MGTMGGANSTKEDKAARKARKKREREARIKKEMIRQAEQYRLQRNMSQLDTQLNTVSNTDSHATLSSLKKNLKSIMRSHNTHGQQILNPNINEIIDDVTSDKTPIAKLQNQVQSIQNRMNVMLKLLKRQSGNGRSRAGSGSRSYFSDDVDSDDNATAAMSNMHSSNKSYLKTTNLANGLSSDSSNKLRLKPTDSMRHRTSYKQKSQINLSGVIDTNALMEEEEQKDDQKDNEEQGGNVTETEMSHQLSPNTHEILQLNYNELKCPQDSVSPGP